MLAPVSKPLDKPLENYIPSSIDPHADPFFDKKQCPCAAGHPEKKYCLKLRMIHHFLFIEK
jgi:hypothetical protein